MPLSQAQKKSILRILEHRDPEAYQRIDVETIKIADANYLTEFLNKLPSDRTQFPALNDPIKSELESIREDPLYEYTGACFRDACDGLSALTTKWRLLLVGGRESKEKKAEKYYDFLDLSKLEFKQRIDQSSDIIEEELEKGLERLLKKGLPSLLEKELERGMLEVDS